MDLRTNWPLLVNAALGNFLAGTASRIFSVSLPTVAASLETTIVGISWAVIAYQNSQISLSPIFGRIGDIYEFQFFRRRRDGARSDAVLGVARPAGALQHMKIFFLLRRKGD